LKIKLGGKDVKKIVVLVDSDLSDLVPGFLAKKREDAELIIANAEASDFDSLQAIGHKIKGEGGSYGFDRITEIGDALERAAISRDAREVRNCGILLRDYLDALQVEYGDPIA
jgi:HPt (histidine-containing phosphotransfer) domain-containing protein